MLKETLAEAKNQKMEETAKLKKEIALKEEELRKGGLCGGSRSLPFGAAGVIMVSNKISV